MTTKDRIKALVLRQISLEDEIDDKEEELKSLKRQLNQVRTKDLPELADELEVTLIRLDNGDTIEIKDTIRASLPARADRRAIGLAWLRDNGHDGLIQRELKLSFGRGDDDIASSTKEQLEETGLIVFDKESVHPQTLAAFIREQLENGEEIPLDVLGGHEMREAKIKRSK